jgi:hypothetical protein
MRKERPFDIARPRTPKDQAKVREKATKDAMGTLLDIGDEDRFMEALRIYGIMPGEPRYERALAREAKREDAVALTKATSSAVFSFLAPSLSPTSVI